MVICRKSCIPSNSFSFLKPPVVNSREALNHLRPHFGTGVKLKGRWRWSGTNHILCSPILLPRSCWPTSDFWVLRGSQLSSDLFLLKNQFVIYSPNFKLLILVFVHCKKQRIVPTQVNTNPSLVGSAFSAETQLEYPCQVFLHHPFSSFFFQNWSNCPMMYESQPRHPISMIRKIRKRKIDKVLTDVTKIAAYKCIIME